MKAVLIFICYIISFAPTSTIYLVRHAEKVISNSNDPQLTQAGIVRAENLKDILLSKKITQIYSTDFKRTISTAKPLSDVIKVPIQIYSNDSSGLMLKHIIKSNKNTLIIAHSNTLLPLLDSINLRHNKNTIPDNEYDNLFIITVEKGKAVHLEEIKYGSLSLPNK